MHVSVGKNEGKGPLEKPRCRREDSIKIDIKEIVCEDVDWIHVAQGQLSDGVL
jgi:hypothetical protein